MVWKNLLKILELSLQVWFVNRPKFCTQQKPWQIFIWPVHDNHCWQRFDSQDWFSWSHTDFSSGLNSGSENFELRIKKQQDFFESAFFREKRTTNIGKSWSNKYYVKISGQNQTLFEKVNSKKYWPKHYNLLLKPF